MFARLLDHRAGGRVDLIIVFQLAADEVDVVHEAAVLAVAVHADAAGLRLRHARMGKRRRERRVAADVRAVRRAGGQRAAVLARGFDDLAADGVHVVLIGEAAGKELHLVDHAPGLHVHLHGDQLRVRLRHARVGIGGGRRRVRADVAAFAGRPGQRDAAGRLRLGEQQPERVDRQPGQILGAQHRVLREQLLDERRLAARDVVRGGQRVELVVRAERLRQHRALHAKAREQLVDLAREALLQRSRALLVAPLHGDEDGVGQLADIAVLQQRTDQRVHRHVERHAGEVHPVDHAPRVVVFRLDLQHALAAVDGEQDARVHVQRDDRRRLMRRARADDAQRAHGEDGAGGHGRHGRHPAAAGPAALPRRAAARRLRAKAVAERGRRVVHGVAQFLFDVLLFHRVKPPPMPVAVS